MVVTYYSKCHRLSLSLIAVNGITLMDKPYTSSIPLSLHSIHIGTLQVIQPRWWWTHMFGEVTLVTSVTCSERSPWFPDNHPLFDSSKQKDWSVIKQETVKSDVNLWNDWYSIPPTDGRGFRDFYHNWTSSILQQMKRKFWNIVDAFFRISWMTNSFK